ncbi:MAG TPA: transposase, partial [Thermoanaerobaculia bacterium]|nr:transposase [Thermoanaerobaculia bacterium]
MARPPRLEFEGATYHVIARGNERRLIFRDDEDRTEYLRLLAAASGETGLKVLAYCLLSNHLHLAVQAASVPLSEVIGPLHSKYARYFNQRHGRTGHLFESRYRAILVDRDSYLLSVVRYIHLNPVKARLASSPERFPWSSHKAYTGTAPAWLATTDVLSFFRPRPNARRLFHEFVGGDSALDVPAYAPDDATFGDLAGGEAFRRQALRAAKHDEIFLRTLTVEKLVSVIAETEGVSVAQLRGPSRVRSL